MKTVTNKFGTAEVCDENDFAPGKIYASCAACMSIYAEFNSWANAHKERMTLNHYEAANIVVLSCQVTDLAVLNDLRTMEKFQEAYRDKKWFIGGCLANRFDIPLPKGVFRLEPTRTDYQSVDEKLIDYVPPFWIKDFVEDNKQNPLKDGYLFRYHYPLRIGVGCDRLCKYCTIRHTRGTAYNLENLDKLINEFVSHDNVVLIADSPGEYQITQWAGIAIEHKKPISIRNVEPAVGIKSWNVLIELARMKLLSIYHSPIQSDQRVTLERMLRPVNDTLDFINRAKELKAHGVICATNIIVDYEDCPNPSDQVYKDFDYVSWNPYWDGKWDRVKAEEKFKKYFGD